MDLGRGPEAVQAVWPRQEAHSLPGLNVHEARAMARQSRWLVAQPPDFAQRLLAQASLRQYRKRQVICGIDEESPGLYFLVRGVVDVWVPRPTRELIPIHLVPACHWFGGIGAMTGHSGLAAYHACTTSAVLCIPRAAIRAVEAEHPAFRQTFLDLLASSVREMMEMTSDLVGLDAEKRVIAKLVTLSGTEGCATPEEEGYALPVSQSELASISNTSRATTNVILAKLEKAGILKLGYRKVLVIKRSALLMALRQEP